MAQQLTRWRFTVDDYHRMGKTGILHEDDRVELIGGEIVQMSPIGSRHHGLIIGLNRRFVQAVGERALVSVQGPLRLGDHDEPVPDLVLLRSRPDEYRESLPTPPDVLLVVEVADTSLAYDRDVKAPLYAGARIPEYWLWDVGGRRVMVYRDSAPDGYRDIHAAGREAALSPIALPEVSIPLDDLLGDG